MAPFYLGPGNVRGPSSSSADLTISQLLPFTILVANKQHFSLEFLFLCSCWLVMSSIFHVLTELLFVSLTERFTQIIFPSFVCMVYCMCGVHTLEYEHVCALLCAHVAAKAGLCVFLNYFLPHCLERSMLSQLCWLPSSTGFIGVCSQT